MSYATYICGTLRCLRCGHVAEECVQTKLIRADVNSAGREYRQGNSVVIDGLGDYLGISQLIHNPMLNVVIGDWDCSSCGLNYQWAKVCFQLTEITHRSDFMPATILSVESFAADQIADYVGVDYIQDLLAEFARYPALNRVNALPELRLQMPQTTIEQVANGYRHWINDIIPSSITDMA